MKIEKLREKYLDLPESLTFIQACGLAGKKITSVLGQEPLLLFCLIELGVGLTFAISVFAAAGLSALIYLAVAKTQQGNTKEGWRKFFARKEGKLVEEAADWLAGKQPDPISPEFAKNAILYVIRFNELAEDISLSEQAQGVLQNLEAVLESQSSTLAKGAALLGRLDAVERRHTVMYYRMRSDSCQNAATAAEFTETFEKAVGRQLVKSLKETKKPLPANLKADMQEHLAHLPAPA